MANPEHLEILKQGVEVWNRWREENPDVRPDLSSAYLSRMDLDGIDLSETDLNQANFYGTFLRKANLSKVSGQKINLSGAYLAKTNLAQSHLREADLSGTYLRLANLSETNLGRANCTEANLNRADLTRANLNGADLSGAHLNESILLQADLTRANLSGTDLNGANLSQARLSEALVGYSTFADVDLREVLGLEEVNHLGPSSIGIDTIFKSQGEIPDSFLRGAGIPEIFITYATSFTGRVIQYYSCFISYSSQDEAFAQRLHDDLQQKGVRCWFAPEDLKIGDKFRNTIDQSIRVHDKLLIILSENSLNSEWVESEVEKAFEEERKRKQTVLFPVRLDEAVMETEESWATEIRRTRHIGDFSRWKDHDSYQAAFERLLRDLKSEE